MLRKLFGGIRMTWARVILFAVITGVYTSFMAMYVPDGNSFREIAVRPEAWILFAIIIICNCKTPMESALKTFVFFLISQPLVYLVQVLIGYKGWEIFSFYKYWFIITIFTFPGAYIGWHIKKNNVLAGIILSVMTVMLAQLGVFFCRDMIANFPNHLLSTIFCFALIVVLIIGVLQNKTARMTTGGITIAALVILAALAVAQGKPEKVAANILLDEQAYQLDESWSVSVENEKISAGEIRTNVLGKNELFMHFYKPGSNTVVLTDAEGRTYPFIITMDEETNIYVEDLTFPESEVP